MREELVSVGKIFGVLCLFLQLGVSEYKLAKLTKTHEDMKVRANKLIVYLDDRADRLEEGLISMNKAYETCQATVTEMNDQYKLLKDLRFSKGRAESVNFK